LIVGMKPFTFFSYFTVRTFAPMDGFPTAKAGQPP